jgi:iron complex outermembrane receptor protein
LELACASPDAVCPLPFSLGADPPLRPVVAVSREVGFDWASPAGTSLALSLFRTDVRDEIVFVTSSTASGYFKNIANTRRQGIETTAGVRLTNTVRLLGSYAYADATYQSPSTLVSALAGNDVHAGSRFPLSPRHRVTMGIETVRMLGPLAATGQLNVRGVSSQNLRGDEANRTEPMAGYAVADLRLQLERGLLTADIGVRNLLDNQYTLYGVYAENPKGAFGGPPPVTPAVERFFTPAYPRSATVGLTLHR